MRRPALLLVVSGTLVAQTPVPLAAPIVRVRLHPDEAWVTRSGAARVAAGTTRFVLRDLPPGLRLDDLRVSASGPEGSRLGDLAVSAEVRVVTETPEYKALALEREGLRDRRDALESEGEALAHELAFLKNLQATYDKDLSTKLATATPNPAAILELSRGLRVRLGDLLGRDRARKRDLEKLGQEERRLDAQLALGSGGHRAAPSRVTVEFTAARPGEVRIDLSYRSRAARWQPAYEARLGADRRGLELVLYAAVTQRSGESWEGVKLEVSNVRASRSLALPRYDGALEAGWRAEPLQLAPGAATGFASVALRDEQDKRQASYTANVYAAAPVTAAEEAVTTVLEEAQGLATTFALDGVKDVPADGEPHRFRVLARELSPDLRLVAAPRLDPTVYQVARFPAPTGLPLFPGAPVVQFAGTQRLGQTTLAVPAAGQPFELGFGPYRGLRIALTRLDCRKELVGAFSRERQWTLRERVDLANDTGEPLDVEVQDRILRSTVEQLKVAALPESSRPEERTPGVNTWTLRVPAQGAAAVHFALQLRAPLEGVLVGLEGLRLPQ